MGNPRYFQRLASSLSKISWGDMPCTVMTFWRVCSPLTTDNCPERVPRRPLMNSSSSSLALSWLMACRIWTRTKSREIFTKDAFGALSSTWKPNSFHPTILCHYFPETPQPCIMREPFPTSELCLSSWSQGRNMQIVSLASCCIQLSLCLHFRSLVSVSLGEAEMPSTEALP